MQGKIRPSLNEPQAKFLAMPPLLQLGQAMQSGALQGDEFRSVAENAPILLDLIAEKLGKTRAEIKELGSDGKITSMVIHDALADATPKLQEMFNKMPVTMSQGFSVLKNEYKKFTHEFMNGEGGISSVVAKGLVDVSRNFENFATILMGTAATWGGINIIADRSSYQYKQHFSKIIIQSIANLLLDWYDLSLFLEY